MGFPVISKLTLTYYRFMLMSTSHLLTCVCIAGALANGRETGREDRRSPGGMERPVAEGGPKGSGPPTASGLAHQRFEKLADLGFAEQAHNVAFIVGQEREKATSLRRWMCRAQQYRGQGSDPVARAGHMGHHTGRLPSRVLSQVDARGRSGYALRSFARVTIGERNSTERRNFRATIPLRLSTAASMTFSYRPSPEFNRHTWSI